MQAERRMAMQAERGEEGDGEEGDSEEGDGEEGDGEEHVRMAGGRRTRSRTKTMTTQTRRGGQRPTGATRAPTVAEERAFDLYAWK